VSNRALKEYFKSNPQEKDILVNDIQKAHTKNNRHLFKALDVMPEYILPAEMIAVTPDQLSKCTIGSATISPGASGNQSVLTLNANLMKVGLMTNFVEPEQPSTLVQNMVGFPAAVQRYKDAEEGNKYADEDPLLKDAAALEPTSGRKLWKLRHGKRLRKHITKDKSGFKGGSA
jgi:hypothetical protein